MLWDEWAIMQNPASLAALGRNVLSLHAENHFLIPEMSTGCLSMGIVSKSGTFGLSYCMTGHAFYNESRSGLSFGKAFGEKFRAGIEIMYLSVRQFSDYGNLHAFIPALGVQVLPLQALTIGIHITNPAGQRFYPHHIMIPSVFRAGVGYRSGTDLLICIEYVKQSRFKPVYSGGIECCCGKVLCLRLGLSSSVRTEYSFGLGIHEGHLNINLAACHHPVLGFSPSVTLSYSL
jgi:hypothetical protein